MNRLSHVKMDMPTGDELIKLLDDERAALDELRGLWHRATDYGVLTKRRVPCYAIDARVYTASTLSPRPRRHAQV